MGGNNGGNNLIAVSAEGSAIRALIKRKKRCLSDFFNRLFAATLPTVFASDANLRFRLLIRTPSRAVARRGDPFSQPSGSSAFVADVRSARRFRRTPVHQPCARPAAGGTRKLSVPGPRSFNSKEMWFPERVSALGVQPVVDSRHGRIVRKVSGVHHRKSMGERPPPIKL
jgi:hypothetical protein